MGIDTSIEQPTKPLDITSYIFESSQIPFEEGGGWNAFRVESYYGGKFAKEPALRIILDRKDFPDDETFKGVALALKGWLFTEPKHQKRYGFVVCDGTLKEEVNNVIASGAIYIDTEGKISPAQLTESNKKIIEASGILDIYPQT